MQNVYKVFLTVKKKQTDAEKCILKYLVSANTPEHAIKKTWNYVKDRYDNYELIEDEESTFSYRMYFTRPVAMNC
ncbi:MAG: hypothetical protein ACOCUT_00155 [bacterium]